MKEKVEDVGYCESYLGVKYPSMRPLSSINPTAQMESWYLQRSKHGGKKWFRGWTTLIFCDIGEYAVAETDLALIHCAEESVDGSSGKMGRGHQKRGRMNHGVRISVPQL